jgi:hypothetical protein
LHRFSESDRALWLSNNEGSVMTWLSVVAMFVLALVCLLAWDRTGRRGWLFVALFFAYLSLDDACMLHERIGWLLEARLGQGRLYRWVEFFGPVIALGGLAAYAFIWRALPVGWLRWIVFLAFGVLGLAVGLEVIERPLQDGPWRWRGLHLHAYTVPVEELFELIGPTLLAAVIGFALEERILEPGRTTKE